MQKIAFLTKVFAATMRCVVHAEELEVPVSKRPARRRRCCCDEPLCICWDGCCCCLLTMGSHSANRQYYAVVPGDGSSGFPLRVYTCSSSSGNDNLPEGAYQHHFAHQNTHHHSNHNYYHHTRCYNNYLHVYRTSNRDLLYRPFAFATSYYRFDHRVDAFRSHYKTRRLV